MDAIQLDVEIRTAKPPVPTHRGRLREQLLEQGAATLSDSELLEMLLFLGEPRRDVRPVVRSLLQHFGSLPAVLAAPPALLLAKLSTRAQTVAAVPFAAIAAERLAAASSPNRIDLGTMPELLAYLEADATKRALTQPRVLLLDSRNRLLADVAVNAEPGSEEMNQVVMGAVLHHHAVAMFLVLYPPGSIQNRQVMAEEAAVARGLARAASPFGVVLHDCLLISDNQAVSLRDTHLLVA